MLTPTSVDYAGAVYSNLPQALGLQLGMVVQSPNTPHFRMLVQNISGGTLTAGDGTAVAFSGSALNYQVVKTAAAANTGTVLGANDLSAQAVPNDGYFWITIKGPAKFLLATTIAAQTIVNTSATAGTLAAASATQANQQTNIYSTASSGSGGITQCWIG